MANPTPITEDHMTILRYLQDGQTAYAQWIAEGCGHAYETPWAAGRLRTLFNCGLVKRVGRCWCITDAGQGELARHEGEAPRPRESIKEVSHEG